MLGSVLHNPDLLISGDYPLDVDDFPHRFHKIIFQTLNHLYKNKQSINIVDIDNHISKYKEQYDIFEENEGLKYLDACKTLANPENFNENCKIIKKYSLLRDAEKCKLNVKELYDPENEEKMEIFNDMDIQDIIQFFERKILSLEQKYTDVKEGIHASENLKEQIQSYAEKPEMGLDCGFHSLNYYIYGLRKKYYLFSSASGFGKTRTLCRLASYASNIMKKPTLFITTELDEDEIKAMNLACVSGVEERKIILNQTNDKEKIRIEKAIKLIEAGNLFIVYCPDFTIEKIEYIIKKYILIHKVEYVFFDYIKVSMSMMQSLNQKVGKGLKSWQMLILLSEKLKMLNGYYNIGIYSATQVSASDFFSKENVKSHQGLLAGSKAIADFADVGVIIRPASEAEIEKHELDFEIKDINNINYQHMFFDIYKNRRGLKDVSIGLYVNLGKLDYKETCIIKNGVKFKVPKVEFA